MEVVGPGFGRNIDLCGFPSKLCRVDTALHLELLNRVDGRNLDVQVEIGIGIGNPVQRVVVPRAAHPCDGDVLIRAVPALAVRCLRRSGKTVRNVRCQRHQLQEIASVQRQFVDTLFGDDGAYRGALCSKRRRCRGYLYGLRCLPDSEYEIDAGCLLYLEFHRAHRGLESFRGNFHLVSRGHQVREAVLPHAIGRRGAACVRACVGGRYSDVGRYRSGGIGDLAGDHAECLGLNKTGKKHNSGQ